MSTETQNQTRLSWPRDYMATQKTLVLIEGHSLGASLTMLHKQVNFSRLCEFLHDNFVVVNIIYYANTKELNKDQNSDSEDYTAYSSMERFLAWLGHCGYTTRLKKYPSTVAHMPSPTGPMAVDALTIPGVEHVILFTANPEMEEVILALKAKGIIVTVISTGAPTKEVLDETSLHIAPYRLKTSANWFIDLRSEDCTDFMEHKN